MPAKYINSDPKNNASNRLSSMGTALLLPLFLLSNNDNEINKKKFTSIVSWIKDYRTWNKYWKELEEQDVLVRLDKKIWMLSPHECYPDGVSQTVLINKWNEACNANTG